MYKVLKYPAFFYLLFMSTCVYADPPDQPPKLLFDKNYIMYNTELGHLSTGGACVDALVGLDFTLWLYKGGVQHGKIGKCETLYKDEYYERNAHILILDPGYPGAKEHGYRAHGLVTIKPNFTISHTPAPVTNDQKVKLKNHIVNKFPNIGTLFPEKHIYGKEYVAIGKSYAVFISYNIICDVSGDTDYGYYSVCQDSKNSGSYIYIPEKDISIRVTKGLPVYISRVFQEKDELVIYGSIQIGKSGSVELAFLIKNNTVKLIFKAEEEGS